MQRRFVGTVSCAHMVLDSCQGALPALAPFFITEHHLTYTAAGGIVFACNIASTLVQPLFGYAADRLLKAWIMPVALLLGGASIAAMGWLSNYHMVLLMAVITGVGIAAFHPVAARLINLEGGAKLATAMGCFGMAGNIGFTIGPLMATWAALHWGLRGSLLFLVPSAAMAVAVMIIGSHTALSRASGPVRIAQDAPPPVVYLAWGENPFWSTLMLIPLGIALSVPFNPMIVMGQEYLPNNVALSSGMTLGVAIGIGGMAGPVVGALADRFGIQAALQMLAALPLVLAAMSMMMRAPVRRTC